ncbi:MAG: T9SS C-terminal target domain-containing protein [Sphingobacteriales bacterium]|nr:MAG: T9SS C-terminal target domain-containing protein [Sphingobacteriales bacterium]
MKANLQKNKTSKAKLSNSLFFEKFFTLILVLVLACATQNAFSQSIFTNPITDANPSANNPYTSGQTVDANLTVSGIGYASGLTAVSSIDRYNLKSWPTGGLSTTDYIEFVLTPNSTFKINLTSLIYTATVSPNGPSSLVLRSSVDAFGSDISTLNPTGQTVSLSAAAFQNRTAAITFRIYGYGATAATGTFSINSFTFNGTVIPTTPTIPVITSTLTASNIINIPSTAYQITANNFPASFNATNLPPGLSINTSNGQITGTPNSAVGSPYNVTVTAINAAGTGSATLVYTVDLQTCTSTGQVVWDFDAPSAGPSSNTTTNLSISDITRGLNKGTTTLVTNASISNGYTNASGNYNAGAACENGGFSLTTSTYFEFTLTPDANCTSTLTAIQFGTRSTSAGPPSFSIRSNLDNYANDIASGTITNTTGASWLASGLKAPTLTSTTSALGSALTYRIYGYGSTTATSNFANWRIDDVKLTVDVTRSVPTTYAITNNGTSYCAGGAGIAVGLAGSQSGVNYQLVLNGTTNIGTAVAGSGSAISFGNQTAAGTYSVNATYNNTSCLSVMSNPFSVSVNNANTWTGTVSTAWENTSNWACGIVPNVSTTQIDIPNAPASGRQPVLNSNVVISGILNLIGTNSTLSLNGNTLTLNSTITGSGSLIGSATSNLIVANDAGAAFTLRINQSGNNNQLNNYTQNRNATVTLNNPLLINGVVNNASTSGTLASGSGVGNLTLLSTFSTTSGIAYLNTGANVSGNVNVQSYFTGGNINMRGTRMIAFPVQDNQVSPKYIFEQIKSQQFFTGPGNTSNNFDLGGNATGAINAITMVTQNESKLDSEYGFNLIPTLLIRTIPATAYFLFYRGNRTNNITTKLNAPFAIPESVTQNYNGAINKGTINIGVTHTANSGDLYNGICAIGNPYPAVIDFDAFLSDNSSRLEDILSIIKPDRTGQITKIGNVSTNNNFNATVGGAAQDIRYIQPCQSFYVRVKSGQSGNVTFNETQKATQITTPARLLSQPDRNVILSSQKQTNNNSTTQKVLRIAITDNIIKNETAVIFKEGSLATYQNEDAILLTNPILNCATLSSDSVTMAINLMPKITGSTTINMLVNSETTNQNLTLNFSNLNDFAIYNLSLKDSYLNTLTAITPTNATYNFAIDKNIKPSFGNKRLSLIIEPKAVLPSNFMSFTVEPEGDFAKLKWQVNDQTDVKYFEILKATDGINFTTIGQSLKTTDSNGFYTYVDEHLDENNYYQIKQINTDGSFETSTIKYLGTQINNFDFKVFPNPVDIEFSLQCPSTTPKNLEITVYDVTGKKIKIFITELKNQLKFNVADLPSGVYILQVKQQNLNHSLFTSKFIKQ